MMRTEQCGASEKPVMRTFVRAPLAREPEFERTSGGVAICRLSVVGEALPASKPPKVSLYIQDGGPLRADEAVRCGFGLHEGDLIETVGNVGAERPKVDHQEVIVTERVKLRARAAREAGAA